MTLTLLRRLVLAGACASLLAAGGAAWYSTHAEAATRTKEEWDKLFPVKSPGGADAGQNTVRPITEYTAAAGWVQGEKPKKDTGPVVKAPPPDPFQYRLVSALVGRTKLESCAQIQCTNPAGPSFTLGVGEQVPADPGGPGKEVREWRLNDLTSADAKNPARAVFTNLETGEERVLTVEIGALVSIFGSPDANAAGTTPGVTRGEAGKVSPDQKPRYIPLREDKVNGVFEYEIPDDEAAFLGDYGDREASKVDVLPDKDGFIIKGMAPDSRARSMGFQKEDRVVSVNGEKVASTEQALGVGRRQYDGGTGTFVVKILRSGKEMNFTFHAPKKKGDRK